MRFLHSDCSWSMYTAHTLHSCGIFRTLKGPLMQDIRQKAGYLGW
jgi:hypothetical protein